MRRVIILALAIVMGHPALAKLPDGAVKINNGYMTGNAYRDLPYNSKAAYVMGVVDGLLLAPFLGAEERDVDRIASCINGIRSDQLHAIVDAYLAAHPELWDDRMHALTLSALNEACKARGKPLRR